MRCVGPLFATGFELDSLSIAGVDLASRIRSAQCLLPLRGRRFAGIPLDLMVTLGIGLGVLIAFGGLQAVLADRNPAAGRIAAVAKSAGQSRQDRGLLRAPTADPRGLMKSFVPSDAGKRTKLPARS